MGTFTARNRTIGLAVVVTAMMVGFGGHPVDAQQPAKTPAPPPLPPFSNQSPGILFEASQMNGHLVGDAFVWTVQGNVKLIQSPSSSLVLTTGTNEFIIDIPKSTYLSAGKTTTSVEQIIHLPMNLATMKVSITSAGTLFEDQQDDSVLIETKDPTAGN